MSANVLHTPCRSRVHKAARWATNLTMAHVGRLSMQPLPSRAPQMLQDGDKIKVSDKLEDWLHDACRGGSQSFAAREKV